MGNLPTFGAKVLIHHKYCNTSLCLTRSNSTTPVIKGQSEALCSLNGDFLERERERERERVCEIKRERERESR
jgi:hypothetical protein